MNPATSKPRRGSSANCPARERNSRLTKRGRRGAVLAGIGTLVLALYACGAPQRVVAPEALSSAAVREAVRTVKRGVNRAERSLIPTDRELDTRLQLAAALMREGERDAALRHLQYATLARPNFFSYRLAYASALRGSIAGSEQALDQLDACIEIEERIGPCWQLRGDVLRELSRPEEAVMSYEQALLLLDEDTSVLRALTSAALEAGLNERAAECAQELLASGGSALDFPVLLLVARAFEANDQDVDAEAYFRSAAAAHRSPARGLALLRDYFQRTGQLQEAQAVEQERRRLSGASR